MSECLKMRRRAFASRDWDALAALHAPDQEAHNHRLVGWGAVYTYRNLEEDIPLGLALNAGEAVESYKKIRRLLNGGRLIPGHEPRIWADPKSLGFRKVSEHAIAIVE